MTPTMQAPHFSAALVRRLVCTLACLGLSHCAHSDQKPVASQSPAKLGWHVVSSNPLTYAPAGHSLPPENRYDPPTFVPLADQQTRFYVPRNDAAHLRQALAWRQASLDEQYRQMTRCGKLGHDAGVVFEGVFKVTAIAVTLAAHAAAAVGS